MLINLDELRKTMSTQEICNLVEDYVREANRVDKRRVEVADRLAADKLTDADIQWLLDFIFLDRAAAVVSKSDKAKVVDTLEDIITKSDPAPTIDYNLEYVPLTQLTSNAAELEEVKAAIKLKQDLFTQKLSFDRLVPIDFASSKR